MNALRLTRKGKKGSFGKRRRFTIIAVALSAVLVFVALWVVYYRSREVDGSDTNQAVLVDQLSSTYPNSSFYLRANAMFHDNGWSLHYISGMAVFNNVDSYRSFPMYGYRIIIMRSHTAIVPDTQALAIFTNEEYSDAKASNYLLDIASQRVVRVRVTPNSTAYFGITPNFVRAMNGDFHGAIVVMMGCSGLMNTQMAEAFTDKGAMAYIGWTGLVSTDHTDMATQLLLRHLVVDKQSVETTISQTLAEVGNDPTYGSTLAYYENHV